MAVVKRQTPWGEMLKIGLLPSESELAPVECGNRWVHPVSEVEHVCRKRELHVCRPVWEEICDFAEFDMARVYRNREGRLEVVRATKQVPTQLRCLGRALATLIYSEELGRFVRRFRRLDVREPRRNGKSWKIEFLTLWYLLRYHGIQVALAAQSMETADLAVWKAVRTNCKQSAGALDAGLLVPAKGEAIRNPRMESEIVLVPSQGDKLRGLDNPMVMILDEVIAVLDAREWLANAAAAQLSIEEPFLMTCTTASGNPESYEFERFERLLEIRDNPEIEPSTLAELWHLEPGKDWHDRKNWYDVNPGLGTVKSYEGMEALYFKALGIPSEEAIFRREHLNEIVDEAGGAVDAKLWADCGAIVLEDDGSRDGILDSDMVLEKISECEFAVAGADMSWGRDLTSLAIIARDTMKVLWVWQFSWVHWARLAHQPADFMPKVQNWQDAGRLAIVRHEAPPSDLFVEYCAGQMADIIDKLPDRVKLLGFDAARAEPAAKAWELRRIPIKKVMQGQYLDDSIATFQDLVRSRMLRHGNDPLLTSAIANAVIDRTGTFDRRSVNKNATRIKYGVRIDPFVAVLSALEALLRPEDPDIVPGSGVKSIADAQKEYGLV